MATIPAVGHISNAARNEAEVKQDLEDMVAGLRQVPGAAQVELTKTISGDTITPDGGGGVVVIDTEASAATDNLANIITTNHPDGSMILIRNANAARFVVVKSLAGGAGQINLDRAVDYTLDDTKKWLVLQRRGSDWHEVLRGPQRLAMPVLAKTGTYTVAKEDLGKIITCSGTFTVNLLAASFAGSGFTLLLRNIGTGVVTVDPNSAELIDGVATIVLVSGQSALLTCDGTGWTCLYSQPLNSGPPWVISNLKLEATVSANAVTITVKTNAGNNPSALDPILVPFRSATIANGDYAVVPLTGALSHVISSGSTHGTQSGVPSRIYVGICNDGGTMRLFTYNPLVSATLDLVGIQDDLLYSSTAEGGAGAADSAQVLYSGTAFTTKAIRLLGYVESTQATAGTWTTTPSKIHVLQVGDKRTGDIIQIQRSVDGAVATGTTVLPYDDTIPQITEGDQYMSKAVTPTNVINLLDVEHSGHYSFTASSNFAAALFQDATANALAVSAVTMPNAGFIHIPVLHHRMRAGQTTATTMRIRAGSGAAGTTTFNGASGARLYAGTLTSVLQIEEIMV